MKKASMSAAACAMFLFGSLATAQQTPAGHPPIRPTMPSGHPPVQQMPSGHPPVQAPDDEFVPYVIAPDPADVESIDSIVKAYYESISGAKGVERDWNRFRSLFLPGAILAMPRPTKDGVVLSAISPDEYVEVNNVYFTNGGYFEREANRVVEEYGHLAMAFSTFESRRSADAVEPYARGINSVQLMNDGSRWWIISITWDHERPSEQPIPDRYLPSTR